MVSIMGAIKPWHLFICLLVVLAIVGASVWVIRNSRRQG
jgi:hypothetical protein